MKPATDQPSDAHPRTAMRAELIEYPREPEHPIGGLSNTATAPSYSRTFRGRAEEAAHVRRELAGYLNGCPAADDLVLIAHELAANSILHTHSRGNSFHVRCELSSQAARIEVEDMGGPWRSRTPDDRPHGLEIVQALTGDDGWGIQPTGTGGRITWARLSW
jgi:hypothetical protein